MNRHPMPVLAAALVLVLGLALPGAASADPRSEQERIDQEVAEASALLENATERAQQAARRYAAANAALPSAEARLGEARGAVAAARVLADTAAREADEAEDRLVTADQQYEDSVAEVDRARNDVEAFVVATFKGSTVAAMNVMLQADGPGDVLSRFGYVDRIVATERAAVDDLVVARLQARQASNEASAAAREAEQTRIETAAALAVTEAAEAEAAEAAQEAEALAQERSDALEVAEAEREESLRRYERAEKESEQVAAELAAWEKKQRRRAASDPPPSNDDSSPGSRSGSSSRSSTRSGSGSDGGATSGALLAMPTQGWKSSDFGNRFDPFYQVWQLHAGVDIAAGGGTPIYAAADGTVARAGWNGGYGNYTCIGHGDHAGQNLSTCYAHQSEILVSPGQWVARGALIGRVGTTGASTGNHLHFEVRLNGTPTNPLPYLPPLS